MTAKDRWSLRNIYMYLVCLITLIMVIVAAVGLVRSAVELIYPDPGYPAAMEKVAPGESTPDVNAEQMEKERDYQRRMSTRNAILGLVGNLAMLAVAGPVYIYHWRRIEKDIAEDSARQTETTA